jgi:hypothetical protein
MAIGAWGAGGLDQALDFRAVEALDTAAAPGGRREPECTAYALDDVLGLVVAEVEVVLAPEPRGLPDDGGEAGLGLRHRWMTAHSAPVRRPPLGHRPSLRAPELRSRRSLRTSGRHQTDAQQPSIRTTSTRAIALPPAAGC